MTLRTMFISMCVALFARATLFTTEVAAEDKRPTHPVDVVEQFVRHAARQQFDSAAALSTSTEKGVRQDRMVQQAHEDAKNQVYWNGVDCRLEGDRAVVLFVCRPRDTAVERSVEAFNVVRTDGTWKVELARPAATEGQATVESERKLRDWTTRRTKEILSIVNAKSLPSYPLSGTWSTHYQQTFLTLTLSTDGQATMINIRQGSHGIDICDYHLENGTIVIETRGGPIRLKRDGERTTKVNGQIYHYLIGELPELLKTTTQFPDGTIRLSPVTRATPAVSRPASLFNDRRDVDTAMPTDTAPVSRR